MRTRSGLTSTAGLLVALAAAGCSGGSPSSTAAPTPITSTSIRSGRVSAVATSPTAAAGAQIAGHHANGVRPRALTPAGPALRLLATIVVKGRASMTGYSRLQFGTAWTDATAAPSGHNGCDTRDDILRRDLVGVRLTPGSHGCTVLTGRLRDPYTGATIAFRRGVVTSRAVQIDHVVALGDAWQTGARGWAATTRATFANDPLELLAVDARSNAAKGDGDAATWLPPDRAYQCAYVARQVAVKARYKLWMTAAERAATVRILKSCPSQSAPVERERVAIVAAPRPNPARLANPAARRRPAARAKRYQNCTALNARYPHGVGLPGAVDHTSGDGVTDFTRDAAVYRANVGSDRDKDGIACEKA